MPLSALFDKFSKSIIYVNGSLAFVMNVTLLHFIVFHSKKHMGTYKYLMLCFSAFNLLYCTMHIVVMPNFHAKGRGFVVIPTSFLKFSMKAGYWGCLMYGCLFIQSLVLLAFHFVYRYLLICKNDWLFVFNSWKYVPIHFSIWLTVGILWIIFVGIYMYHGEILTGYFQYELWEIYRVDLNKTPSLGPLYKYPNALGVEVWDWGVLMASGICVSEMCASFSVILFCTWKIHHFFETSASTMSDKSRSLQMQLFRALLIQTVIPVIFEYIPCALNFGCPFLGIPFGRGANFTPILVSFYPVLDPMSLLYFIKDYRYALFKKLRLKDRSISDSSSKKRASAYTPQQTISTTETAALN
ncbi:unnamed protein product, partial [Mesorhabditis belari]|uniref:Seven TM Receptor n=1 Tax=Mesorhabditis belari TaxID=2138241 RepID=A0AAF3JAG5_9BILA